MKFKQIPIQIMFPFFLDRRRCPRYLRRKCVVVKLGYKKRRLCFCVRRCYGDEALNDNQLSDKIPEDETEALEENTEDEQMDTGQ